ncbi:hypothetical protein MVEN_00889600 [Mycena venus]|uniref:Uncharacterized protein n=1 Tax=Mycena venus TaxID=2733690 RepID=A0A8H6YC77_9AGAR|nr:hypothetical protein MVEN_00889600 [Mycena venus]
MYTFKFFSFSAIFLFALVQGVVSQDAEPVPQGGLCDTIAGPVCIETMWIFMLLTAVTLSSTETLHVFAHLFYIVMLTVVYTGAAGLKCCIIGPKHGICSPNCPPKITPL